MKQLKILFLFVFQFYFLNNYGQSTDLVIQKTGPNSVYVGGAMSYTFVISNNGPTDVTNATFNDNLPINVSNVSYGGCTTAGGAVCPSSVSATNSNFSGTIPNLPVGSSITMTLNLNAPAPVIGSSFSNTATVSTPAGITEIDPTTNTSTWNVILNPKTDIEVIKENSPTGVLGCPPAYIDYVVKWINHGPASANGLIILDNLMAHNQLFTGSGNANFSFAYTITNLTWYASSGSVAPTGGFNFSNGNINNFYNNQFNSFQKEVSVWEAGDTIILSYRLNISAPTITGCGRNLEFDLINRGSFYIQPTLNLQDTVSSNNTSIVTNHIGLCTTPVCPKTDIEVIKENSPTGVLGCPPAYIDYVVKWINHGPASANGLIILDNLMAHNQLFTGSGNANFSFAYTITNLTWYASSGSVAPTGGFNFSNGNINNFYNNQFNSFQKEVSVWEAGDTIILSYRLNISAPTITGCGRNLEFDLINRGSFYIQPTLNLQDTVSSNNTSIVTNHIGLCTTPVCPKTDIEVIKENSPTGVLGCPPAYIDYVVKWINHGPASANGLIILDNLMAHNQLFTGSGNANFSFAYTITNLTWYASSGSVAPTGGFNFSNGNINNFYNNQFNSFQKEVSVWEAGDTIILSYRLNISAPTITGCGRNLEFDLINRGSFYIQPTLNLQDTVSSNNTSIVTNVINSSAVDISISKSVIPVIVTHLDSVTISNIFQNATLGISISNVFWTDTIPSELNFNPISLTCIAGGGATCGSVTYDPITRILRQDIANIPSGGIITVTYKAEAYYLGSSTTVNTASRAFNSCIDCVPATNFTETNFEIQGLIFPVELVYFNGVGNNCGVELNWMSATEKNFDRYVIEQKLENGEYVAIGSVVGKGSNTKYQFTIPNVNKHVGYRLKMVDSDGSSSYSRAINITDPCKSKFQGEMELFPNPIESTHTLTVMYTSEANQLGTYIRIIGLEGKEIERIEFPIEKGTNIQVLEMKKYQRGVYMVQILDNKGVLQTKKLVVQ